MNFFDKNLINFSPDSQYYFNVLVKTIAIHPQCAKDTLWQIVNKIYFIDHITDQRPYIIYCFIDNKLSEDMEFEIQCYPHCVVKVSQSSGISWQEISNFNR